MESKASTVETKENAVSFLKENFAVIDRVIMIPSEVGSIRVHGESNGEGLDLETYFQLKFCRQENPIRKGTYVWKLKRAA